MNNIDYETYTPQEVSIKEHNGGLRVTFYIDGTPEAFKCHFKNSSVTPEEKTLEIDATEREINSLKKSLKEKYKLAKDDPFFNKSSIRDLISVIKSKEQELIQMKKTQKLMELKSKDEFEFFWKCYSWPKIKGTKALAKKRWLKLKRNEKKYINTIVKDYVLMMGDCTYKKNAENFLKDNYFLTLFDVFAYQKTLHRRHSMSNYKFKNDKSNKTVTDYLNNDLLNINRGGDGRTKMEQLKEKIDLAYKNKLELLQKELKLND